MNSTVKTHQHRRQILVFIVLAGIGFAVTYFLKGAIDTALQPFQPAIEQAKTSVTTAISNIQTTWASIPNEVKGVVALAIPSAFAVFFAWTKTRAMNKLQQTQLDAQKQFAQMTGEAKTTQEQIKLLMQQKQTLETQISQQANSTSQDLLGEAQQMVSVKTRELENMRSAYDELFRKLEEYKQKTQVIIK